MTATQHDFFAVSSENLRPAVVELLANRVEKAGRPSARELLRAVEQRICLDAANAHFIAPLLRFYKEPDHPDLDTARIPAADEGNQRIFGAGGCLALRANE